MVITVTKKKVRISVESITGGASESTVIVGSNRLTVGSWSTVTVKHNRVNAVRQFYEMMSKSKFVRQSLVTSWFTSGFGSSAHSYSYQIEALRHCLEVCAPPLVGPAPSVPLGHPLCPPPPQVLLVTTRHHRGGGTPRVCPPTGHG